MPIRSFEDVPGDMFKALEEAGHGRRIVIADRSLDIERDAEIFGYRGRTSAQALNSVLRLVRHEGPVTIMHPDLEAEGDELAEKAFDDFSRVLREHSLHVDREDPGVKYAYRFDEDMPTDPAAFAFGTTGFYSLLRNPDERRLFIRTPDSLPYACATFIVGHSQVGVEITD